MAETPQLASREFLNFQQNLKKTALGLKFGRTLFTNPDSLDGAQITTILNALGFPIPKEIKMTAEAAQAITTGQTVADSYATAESVGQFSGATASAGALISLINSRTKFMGNNEAAAVSIVTNVCLIISSCFTNVAAWVGLAMTIQNYTKGLKSYTKIKAAQGVLDQYNAITARDAQNITMAFQDLKDGKTGIFGFLAEAATGGSLFENCIIKNPDLAPIQELFPLLKFIPIHQEVLMSSKTKNTFLTGKVRSTAYLAYDTIGKFTKEEAFDYFFYRLIVPYLEVFYELKKQLQDRDRAGLIDLLAICALTNANPEDGFTVLDMFKNNYFSAQDFVPGMFSLMPEYNQESGLSWLQTRKEPPKNVVINADVQGRQDIVQQNQWARKFLEEKFSFEGVNFDYTLKPEFFAGAREQPTSPMVFSSRKMSNFLSALDFMDMIRLEPDYQYYYSKSKYIPKFDFLPTTNEFSKRVEYIKTLSTLRIVNRMALENVANFLNTSSDKLKLKYKVTDNRPAIFV